MRKIKYDFRHKFYDLMYQEQYEEANKELMCYLKKNKKSFHWFMLKCKNVDDISFLFTRENCHSFDVFGATKPNKVKIENTLKRLSDNCTDENIKEILSGSLAVISSKEKSKNTLYGVLAVILSCVLIALVYKYTA